ncbi:hypothetical protein D3C87_1951990 [compost metagenome]
MPAEIVADDSREVSTREAIAPSKPLKTKTLSVLALMLMPDSRAASRLPPMA